MLTLLIDTSTLKGFIAFAKEEALIFQSPLESPSSKTLFPLLCGSFEMLKIHPKDLDLIGVAIGPGSFTGVRVGVSVAKGLSLGAPSPIPLVGFASTELDAPRDLSSILNTVHQKHRNGESSKEGHLQIVYPAYKNEH